MTPSDLPVLPLAAAFGLLVGSFLNVVIFRLPRGTSVVWPASACGGCKRELRWFENIPILSWVVLGAKCARCKSPISIQYPLVEAITAGLFVLVVAQTPAGPLLAARLIFVCGLIVLFGIDLEHKILPNEITLPGVVIGVAFSMFGPPGWRSSLLGALLGGGSLYAIAYGYYAVRKVEGLGMGDVKMLAAIGAFLGWQAVLLTLVLSSFAGAIIGVALIAGQRGSMKYELPFGTFLALGALVAMLAGQPIIDWYVGFY
ncbi:MAG TPA: prepilin peptidase [Vicinamibacterales bacterium]|nr:prepilin peptidase [Vicinamibacterales bacterium]